MLRVLGYDYGTYKKQYEANAAKYKNANGMTEDEYMSRMKKADKLIPVMGKSHGMGLFLYMKCLIFQKQWNHLSMIIRCIW